ncbi:TetR/AcrR family transcriptional regulator [Spirilliplanes yamanashiensis]|nr:TetR family transcriptional regulator [Spirilliplanes yamanashiensis]MDP9814300.1 AcrR family transcriptional regulator [Spirilliplanes yamanashiensis]
MAIPYESTGRIQQKTRTREALVAATRALLAEGVEPTVEQAAAAARISRTTAYRYFPGQRELLLAAHPEIDRTSLLPADAPADVERRLDLVVRELARINLDWEPQLRAALRLSLEAGRSGEPPVLRGGRAIGWIEDALGPLRDTHPGIDVRRLAVAIRAAAGIEALVWLTDVAGVGRAELADLASWSARALLRAARAEDERRD